MGINRTVEREQTINYPRAKQQRNTLLDDLAPKQPLYKSSSLDSSALTGSSVFSVAS